MRDWLDVPVEINDGGMRAMSESYGLTQTSLCFDREPVENPIVSLCMARSVRGQAEKTKCFYRTYGHIRQAPAGDEKRGGQKHPE